MGRRIQSFLDMGRKQKRRIFLDDEYNQTTSHLSFGDDGEEIIEKQIEKKEEVKKRVFSPQRPIHKPESSSPKPSKQVFPSPPPKKKPKFAPKEELIAFRKDLPIYSGTYLSSRWPWNWIL